MDDKVRGQVVGVGVGYPLHPSKPAMIISIQKEKAFALFPNISPFQNDFKHTDEFANGIKKSVHD